MRGYESRGDDEPGGCREVWVLTRVVFAVLLPPLGAILALMLLIVAAFLLLPVHPLLSLLALSPIGLAVALVIRRDRRLQDEIERGIRPPPGR